MSQVITALIKSPSNECPYLTVEFLRNNLPWGEDIEVGTKHFAFGREKAKIVLECWDLIQEYADSNGSIPPIHETKYFNIPKWASDAFITTCPYCDIQQAIKWIDDDGNELCDFKGGEQAWQHSEAPKAGIPVDVDSFAEHVHVRMPRSHTTSPHSTQDTGDTEKKEDEESDEEG
jgi:hypothetical protein